MQWLGLKKENAALAGVSTLLHMSAQLPTSQRQRLLSATTRESRAHPFSPMKWPNELPTCSWDAAWVVDSDRRSHKPHRGVRHHREPSIAKDVAVRLRSRR